MKPTPLLDQRLAEIFGKEVEAFKFTVAYQDLRFAVIQGVPFQIERGPNRNFRYRIAAKVKES
jgi:hypothetical protein